MPVAIPIIVGIATFVAANASWIVPVVSLAITAASYLLSPKPKPPSLDDFANRATGGVF